MILEWAAVFVWIAFFVSLVSVGVSGSRKLNIFKARLNIITGFWFVVGIVPLGILAFVYLRELFLLTAFVLIFMTAFTGDSFTKEKPISAPDAPLSEKIQSQIGSLAEYGNQIMALNFIVPPHFAYVCIRVRTHYSSSSCDADQL